MIRLTLQEAIRIAWNEYGILGEMAKVLYEESKGSEEVFRRLCKEEMEG